MADASALVLKIRNRAAAAVRFAGHDRNNALIRETPRSSLTDLRAASTSAGGRGGKTADRWRVEFFARSPTVFAATMSNEATTPGGEYSLIRILNEGTKPHPIRPYSVKALHFYAPRFAVRQDGFVFAKLVNHPGTTGSGFYDKIVNPGEWRAALIRGLAAA